MGKEVVLAAVKENGFAWQYAADHLQNDNEVIQAAMLDSSCSNKMTKRIFTKGEKIMPEAKGINVMLKCVMVPKILAGFDSWKETVCGDDTGTVIVSLRTERHAEICTVGAYIRVLHATARMVKGHIRLVPGKKAAFKPASEQLEFMVKENNNISFPKYSRFCSGWCCSTYGNSRPASD